MRLEDYAINTNMQMRAIRWIDHNDNKVKNKCIMLLDGKVLDPNGILLIIKGEDDTGGVIEEEIEEIDA